MKLIGITGPTGAGKTTALGALKELGVQIIDADAVYHRLLAESAPLRQALTDRFGTEILDGAGGLDRKRLGAVVFADPAALEALNAITGPFIRAELDRLCAQAEQAGKHAAIDAIGLVESGIGVALVMEFACNQDTLCLRPLEPEIESGCLLVWKKNLTLSPATQRFIEYVKEYLTEMGKEDMKKREK